MSTASTTTAKPDGRVSHLGPLRREALKLLAQKRSYIGAGLLTIIPIAIAVLTKLAANPHGGDQGGGVLFMRLLTRSGLYIPLSTLLMAGIVILPLSAAMVGGFLIAGESEQGTLRTVLVRPVRRGSMLLAKWTVGVAYLAIILALLTVVGLVAGVLLFGLHPIMSAPSLDGPTLEMHMTQISVVRALGLIALCDLVMLGYLAAVMSLALLISTIGDSSLTAAIVTTVLVLVSVVVFQFPYLADVRPYVVTSHVTAWYGLLETPTDWRMVGEGLLAFAGYTAAPMAAAWYVFRRKDILS